MYKISFVVLTLAIIAGGIWAAYTWYEAPEPKQRVDHRVSSAEPTAPTLDKTPPVDRTSAESVAQVFVQRFTEFDTSKDQHGNMTVERSLPLMTDNLAHGLEHAFANEGNGPEWQQLKYAKTYSTTKTDITDTTRKENGNKATVAVAATRTFVSTEGTETVNQDFTLSLVFTDGQWFVDDVEFE